MIFQENLDPILPRTALIVTPNQNHRNRDFSGGFLPWSLQYAQEITRYNGKTLYSKINIDMSPLNRFVDLCEIVRFHSKYDFDTLAMFSHGYRNGTQLGLNIDNIPAFVALLPDRCDILLYACTTGTSWYRKALAALKMKREEVVGGEGGFADALSDEAYRKGKKFRILAHYTAGTANRNPHIRIWDTRQPQVIGCHYEFGKTQLKERWRPWYQWVKESKEHHWCHVLDSLSAWPEAKRF